MVNNRLYEIHAIFSNDLYKRLRHIMYLSAFSIIEDHHDAEDIVQDAFYNAINNINDFHGEMNEKRLKKWLNKIIINKALDYIRKIKRRPFNEADQNNEESLINNLASTESNTQEEQTEELELMLEKISQLPEPLRNPMVLRYYGLNCNEAAQILEIQEGTYKTRLHRALNTLKERLVA